MCGIAGYFDASEPASEIRVKAMTDRLLHRGPDAGGFALVDTRGSAVWNGQGPRPDGRFDLGLGHRRLSIIDLSDSGLQPMASHDRRQWIVYNGEIYNYLELRIELHALGHAFHSDSDTEVLLAAYREWGTACLSRFNGMWAFALWDADRNQLFCARDRFGVKPLYYAHGPDWFVFGSEIKALLAHPRVPRAPNDAIVFDYLSQRLVDHTNETFFAGIHALPGAHSLTYRPGSQPVIQRYWDVRPAFELETSPAAETAAIEKFRDLFDDAVRVRLRADVPIGTCLSGGVDSSSIVVNANRLMFDELHLDPALVGDRQRTFTACFEDPRIDERKFVDAVIAVTGASTHRVFPSGERLWQEMPALVAQMDEPFHSTSQYSQYNVMRLVRESGVTVTLDGQGADELMAGYPGYHGVFFATLLRAGKLLAAARTLRANVQMSQRGRSAADLVLRAGYGLLPTAITTPIRTRLAPFLSSRSPEGRSLQVLRPELRERFEARRIGWIEERAASMHDLGKKLYDDVFKFSLPCLLRYADRNSMAFSIESRMPLLDYRLVEHIFSLPLSLIMRDGWTKWIFRRSQEGRLPPIVQWRKDKLGFVTPEGLWLKQGRTQIADVLNGELASSRYLDATRLRAELGGYLNDINESAFYSDVFRWYVLELWMRSAFSN